jgi:amino acid adenylation domain-containing protein
MVTSMAAQSSLQDLLDSAAGSFPDKIAVEEPGHGTITYRNLVAISDRLRDRLGALGVRSGDRVGIYLRKSIDAVAAIFGILKAGATYVPVDPGAPAARNAYILHDCAVRVAIIEERFTAKFLDEMAQLGPSPKLFRLQGTGAGVPLAEALDREDAQSAPPISTLGPAGDDLAYILYTSGSTGKPKGVMLSHHNALSFIDWCSDVFQPRSSDRFSSHAPFHFDLSILDIYVPLKHGATLVLIAEDTGKEPQQLAPLIEDRQISVWYSAPSILSLLAQYGNLEHHEYSSLRLVLFAGEVFPVKHLRALQKLLPGPRYFNLYGPTETNVCTFYEIPNPISDERAVPFPIGRTCSHLKTRVVNDRGEDVPLGEEGELVVSGRGVMHGYWGLPEQSARSFLANCDAQKWYKTGDIVIESPDGNYTYVGRRDRMVKRRGYRVELGEIEAGLYRHPLIREAAVIALPDDQTGVKIKAFLSSREAKRPSLIALKQFCAENLPLYMIPDAFSWHDALPKTSTDKIDYQSLKRMN